MSGPMYVSVSFSVARTSLLNSCVLLAPWIASATIHGVAVQAVPETP